MRILAIDPGSEKSAWVDLVDGAPYAFNLWDNDYLVSGLALRHNKHQDHLVIEMVACYGMPVGAEVFETCVWIGRFIEAYEGQYSLVYRKDVKIHLCGSMRAKDSNIRQALIDRFGGDNKAIGGVKCKRCHGKGWRGRGRPTCDECAGSGWLHAPGPLHGFHDDLWQALAVAVTFADTHSPVPVEGS